MLSRKKPSSGKHNTTAENVKFSLISVFASESIVFCVYKQHHVKKINVPKCEA